MLAQLSHNKKKLFYLKFLVYSLPLKLPVVPCSLSGFVFEVNFSDFELSGLNRLPVGRDTWETFKLRIPVKWP
jgi:hypothetical protein